AEDMGTGFISGNYPMMFSGSWWFGRLADEMKDPWGQFVFPGNFAPGSSGNLWVVPENAKNKELAYEFIDITLSDEVQAIFGEQGGLPVVGGTDNITDEATKTLTDNFQNLAKDNKLAFYPDWPVAGFYDQLVSNMQSLMSGSKTPEQAMQDLQTAYEEGRADLLE
ncbi:extracellular solute-binding protein, partial [Actinotignum sp. GS-2025e]